MPPLPPPPPPLAAAACCCWCHLVCLSSINWLSVVLVIVHLAEPVCACVLLLPDDSWQHYLLLYVYCCRAAIPFARPSPPPPPPPLLLLLPLSPVRVPKACRVRCRAQRCRAWILKTKFMSAMLYPAESCMFILMACVDRQTLLWILRDRWC